MMLKKNDVKYRYLSISSAILLVLFLVLTITIIGITLNFYKSIGVFLSILICSIATAAYLSYVLTIGLNVIYPKYLKNKFARKVRTMPHDEITGTITSTILKQETYQGLLFYLVTIIDANSNEYQFYLLTDWYHQEMLEKPCVFITASRYLIGWEPL